MLKAGELRHRIVLARPIYDQDTNGDPQYEWLEVATLWAKIAPLSARDFIAAQAEQAKIVARITIRYRADVDAGMHILHNQKVYKIEGVLPDDDSGLEYLTLPCSYLMGPVKFGDALVLESGAYILLEDNN